MPCYHPLTGYYSRERTASGKRGIVFKVDLSFSGVPIRLPCGQCVGCRLEHSRQWAMRCVHENQLHPVSSFVTLTYDDACLPPGNSLSRRDTQLFLKRLRNGRGRFRYYGCGEYGEKTNRPHYHIILFGINFDDKKFYSENKRGDKLFSSKELEGYWPLGHCRIGEVTFDSAAYCARYVMKKIKGDLAESHYVTVDQYGEVHEISPEFPMMSRRPGIGRAWFDRYGRDAYRHDSVIMRGMEVPPPRYYDGLYEVLDSARLTDLKKKRRRKAAKSLSERSPERRRVRETVTKAQIALKGRVL